MDDSTSVIVSDAHLGAAPVGNERAFHDFLRSAGDRTRDLVINGDLFDFWFEYRTVILRRHFLTLRILSELVEAGVRIRLLGGNHDFWGGSFLRNEIGIELVEGPLRTRLGGCRSYVAHGDGLGTGDWGYRLLRSVIRSRPASLAFRQLHPDWSDRLIGVVSRTKRRHGQRAEAGHEIRSRRLREHAERLLRDEPQLELVAFGHCHVPELHEIFPGRFYVNTGDWVQHCTWAEIGPGGVTLHRWPPR